MLINKKKLKECMPFASQANIDKYIEPLNAAMERYHINTGVRMASFLAQIAHESGSLKYNHEIASGAAYDTGRKARDLGNTPEADGDGQRYKGAGLIQITGLKNFMAVSKELNYDFIRDPAALRLPGAASYAACWFWYSHGLNEIADDNSIDAFKRITRKINGGLTNIGDRLNHWLRCRKALGV